MEALHPMKSDMRMILTRRLLCEGLLRCLKRKPIEKITVNELCAESGVHRTTFYKHYRAPIQILHDMACDYAAELRTIFEETLRGDPQNIARAAEACCEYLYDKKEEIKLLFSENAGRHLERTAIEIMSGMARQGKAERGAPDMDVSERALIISASGMAAYGLLTCWLTEDIPKTPHEIVAIMQRIFGLDAAHPAFRELLS